MSDAATPSKKKSHHKAGGEIVPPKSSTGRAGKGGKRAKAGRPKGARDTAARTGTAAARELAAQPHIARILESTKIEDAPSVVPDGITPKDLLVRQMRTCWAQGHALAGEAHALDRSAAHLCQGPERETMRAQAVDMRKAAQDQFANASKLAMDVAPYMHAKLQNIEQRVAGDIIIEIKEYADPAMGAAPSQETAP